jgi:hypothetical protein
MRICRKTRDAHVAGQSDGEKDRLDERTNHKTNLPCCDIRYAKRCASAADFQATLLRASLYGRQSVSSICRVQTMQYTSTKKLLNIFGLLGI